ncbi:hypothetical protein ACOMHN_038883 [Nucella lapillus]
MSRFMQVKNHANVKQAWTKEGRIHALLKSGRVVSVNEGDMTGLGPDSDGRSGEQGLRAGAGGHGQKSDIRQTRGSSVSPISSTPRPSGHRQREAALAAKTSLRRSGSRGSKSTDIEKKRSVSRSSANHSNHREGQRESPSMETEIGTHANK